MDFGGLALDGSVLCSESGFPASSLASDPETKQKWYGSGLLKQERSSAAAADEEDDWRRRDLKVAKTADDFSSSKEMLLQKTPLLRSNTTLLSDGQQMLSFSPPTSQTVAFPYYSSISSSPYATSRNAGFGSGGLIAANMQELPAVGMRGPFTPSQWMELEHQALIYKYITANVPVPSNLLFPIRKALDSTCFSTFQGLRSQTMGWGAFHLGFSNNTDPEPGRCRRTDGKKWRCSRDAVADQKYCDRHMNRGRHRSRKPVEGQTGHSVSGSAAPATASKLMPIASSASASVTGAAHGGGASNSLGLSHHQLHNNSLKPGAVNNFSVAPSINSKFQSKESVGEKVRETTGLSMLFPTVGIKENQFSFQDKKSNGYQESCRPEFGLVSSASLLNPFHKNASIVSCRNYGSSNDLNVSDSKSQKSLHQFMDDWPRNQSDRSGNLWPDFDLQSERTQLSISIPMASTNFMSSTSSPTGEKLELSPLHVSQELQSTQMGLGMGIVSSASNQRQASWIPISWESSMGGPLGEVLHSTNNNNSSRDCKKSSALNLMTDGWDSSSSMTSSPTGVLQKSTFTSFSNSSAGSSPRAAENNSLKEPAFAMAQPL